MEYSLVLKLVLVLLSFTQNLNIKILQRNPLHLIRKLNHLVQYVSQNQGTQHFNVAICCVGNVHKK